MKKIALTLVALSTLGLAACGDNAATNNTSNVSEALNEAGQDLDNAIDASENAAANVVDATGNLTEAAGNVADTTATAVANETKK